MIEPTFALHLALEVSIPVRGILDGRGVVRQVQSGQPLIRRNASQAGSRNDSAIDGVILMSQAVIIAEGEQRTKLKLDRAGFAGPQDFILHDRRVLALQHENGLLDLDTLNFKREDREWIEPELFEKAKPCGVHDFLVLIRAQIKRVAVDENSFFQLGKQDEASDRRLRGSDQQTVIAAGVDSRQRGRGEASNSIGL